VGWSRIGVTAGAGGLLTVRLARRAEGATPVVMLLFGVLFGLRALWTWMGQWTRFVVDARGLTVSLGGFLPRRSWPLEDFRTVQLRKGSEERRVGLAWL